ncbi:MAG: hypothetical protein AAB660_02330 [Patescibacteria group bacterium]
MEKFPNAFADDDEEEGIVRIFSTQSKGQSRYFPGEESTMTEEPFGEGLLGSGDCHFRAWANALACIELGTIKSSP